VNVAGTLTNPPNAIALIVSPVRPPGRPGPERRRRGQCWNTSSSNWLNGAALDRFIAGTTVRFTAAGSNNTRVNLVGVLNAASTVVDAAKDYTFGGSGALVGNGGVIKTTPVCSPC